MNKLMMKNDVKDEAGKLLDAFNYFNAATEKLTQAYSKLEDEVARINKELEEKNAELIAKIYEVDHVKSHLENILYSMNTAVIATNLDERITTINNSAKKLLSENNINYIGKRINDILKLDGISDYELCGLIRSGLVDDKEYVLFKDNGDKYCVSLSSSIIKNSLDEKIGYIVLIHDLSFIKKLQEKARRSDRLVALGEMASRVAHEVRNPLGGIEGFASLLERTLDGDKNNQRLAQYIIQGARSVNHIVTSLLDYARPVYITRNIFSLEDAVLEVCASIQDNARKKHNIVVDFKSHSGITVYGDKVLFQQVLWNLISNSSDAMKNNGEIRLEYNKFGSLKSGYADSALIYNYKTLDETHLDFFEPYKEIQDNVCSYWNCLSVKDTGAGIPPDYADQVFNPFYTTKENGTGLGLSTVYKIIEEHGWKIGVNSCLGRGTWMNIYFPAHCNIQEGVVV